MSRRDDQFPTTSWDLLHAIRGGDRASPGTFARRYRKPILRFFERLANSNKDAAEDLAQDFYINVILSGKLIAKADAKIGRFRGLFEAGITQLLWHGRLANASDLPRRLRTRSTGRSTRLGSRNSSGRPRCSWRPYAPRGSNRSISSCSRPSISMIQTIRHPGRN
jgi:hypothetical protein